MAGYDYDLFTIGAGSGGVAASRRAGSHGARVGICEVRGVGGTCVLRGCVPKKLFVYGAGYREQMEDAIGFGWSIDDARLDWAALTHAKRAELKRLEGIYRRALSRANVDVIEGRGKLIDAHTVEVDGKRCTAEHILVATGAHPHMPAVEGIDLAITSDEALDLEQLPARVVVVGGGYIGVEFAGIFAAAGVKTSLLIRGDAILRGFDQDVRTHLSEEMTKRGISIRAGTHVSSIRRTQSGLHVATTSGHGIDADVVLYATGRHPNSAHLGLGEVGVACTSRGAVVVDEASQTSVPSIWAVGDVVDQHNLTPVAVEQGRSLADRLFAGATRISELDNIATAVFSMPEVGTVGMSEEQARDAFGDEIDVWVARFRPMKATLSGREEKVLIKLIASRADDRVVGCHMVGDHASELVQGLAVALKAGATKADFDRTMAVHPTAGEEFVLLGPGQKKP